MQRGEQALYEPVLKDLDSHFKKIGDPHLEVTGKGKKPSERLKKRLDDFSLYLITSERFIPDIMGYVVTSKSETYESSDIIVVEVKAKKVQVKDILQARGYGTVFDAQYALLISSEELPEEIRRFYDRRYGLAVHRGYERVKVGRFDDLYQRVVDWYPEPPFKDW